MTGAVAEINSFEYSFDDMNTNIILSDICTDYMNEVGLENISRDTTFKASIDMGNVSYVVPSIHPFFDITNGIDIPLHRKEFAKATISDYAKDQMIKMALSLALTGYKIISNQEIYKEIVDEFKKTTQQI